jgi:hypothetical protein
MITKINGSKYKFEIVSEKNEQDSCFFIKAKSMSTRRTSCINNLNPILSEFNISGDDPKAADSMWVVTKAEADYFKFVARQFLTDPSFLDYLERKLDEDRRFGEWENKS